jgi:hypothetical protein
MKSIRELATIVVAADLSESACAALAWAVGLARQRAASLAMSRTIWIRPAVLVASGAALAMTACASRNAVPERTYVGGVPFAA